MSEVKYHINPETGNPGVCRASVRPCRFGSNESHYSSKEGAREAYELQMTRSTLQVVAGGRPKNLDDTLYDHMFPLELKNRGKALTMDDDLISDRNRSVSCPDCGRRLGNALVALAFESTSFMAYCKKCRVENDSHDFICYPTVSLNPDSPTYAAANPENVSKMIWYHWTDREDWATDIMSETGPSRIHLGGERASADRKVGVEGHDGRPGYLYAVEVLEEASIDELLHDEETDDFTVKDTNESDVVRYKNMYEDSGSISLCVKPKSVRVLGVRNFSNAKGLALSTYFRDMEAQDYLDTQFPESTF